MHSSVTLTLSLHLRRRNHVIPAKAHIPGATLSHTGLVLGLLVTHTEEAAVGSISGKNGVQAIWASVENLRNEKTQETTIVLATSLTWYDLGEPRR